MDIDKVHPQLRDAVEKLPVPDASKKLTRTMVRLATRFMPVPRTESVSVSTVKSGGVRLRIYRPEARLMAGCCGSTVVDCFSVTPDRTKPCALRLRHVFEAADSESEQ